MRQWKSIFMKMAKHFQSQIPSPKGYATSHPSEEDLFLPSVETRLDLVTAPTNSVSWKSCLMMLTQGLPGVPPSLPVYPSPSTYPSSSLSSSQDSCPWVSAPMLRGNQITPDGEMVCTDPHAEELRSPVAL